MFNLLCQGLSCPADLDMPHAGSCSGEAHAWDLASGQSVPVGKHDAPVRHVQYLTQLSLLVTGSWDRYALLRRAPSETMKVHYSTCSRQASPCQQLLTHRGSCPAAC